MFEHWSVSRLNNASQAAHYGQVCCPGARSMTRFSTTPTISCELALTVLPKLSNSNFSLQFDPLKPIQSSRCHCCQKKAISTSLNFDFNIPAFFILGDAGAFQCLYCHLVSTLYWNNRVSSQVMMFSINSGSSSNLSRKSEQICWQTSFW